MILFFLAFFIIAPLLLLYATGYRYDFSRNRIIQTGTLMVESRDAKEATLFLNDERYPEGLKVETFIDNLLPGEYSIKIEKEGYHTWNKKVVINSRLTTFLKDIILFKESIPEQLVNAAVEDIYPSPDGSRIAYVEKETGDLYLYFSELRESELLLSSRGTQISKLQWAASGKKLLVTSPFSYTLVTLGNTPEVTALSAITSISFEEVIWDSESDNLLYGKINNGLFEINILAASSEQIVLIPFSEGVLNSAFFAENQDVFYIVDGATSTLFKYNALLDSSVSVIEVVPSQNYRFLGGNTQFITLIDSVKEKVYVINKNPLAEERLLQGSRERIFDATDAVWHSKDNSLLLFSPFEIKAFDFDSNSETLINRYGEPIIQALWHPAKQHAIIQFEDRIDIIEIYSDSGAKNIFTVAEFDTVYNIGINDSGTSVFFSGEIGKQQGLYSLELK